MTVMTRHAPHRLATLVAALATLSLILGGCITARKEQPIKTTEEQALAECARISNELRAVPGVTDVYCEASGYGSNILITPAIHVEASIDASAERDTVADRATELAWLSNLHPLDSMLVSITASGVDVYGKLYHLASGSDAPSEDTQELTKRFGPRPSPTLTT